MRKVISGNSIIKAIAGLITSKVVIPGSKSTDNFIEASITAVEKIALKRA